MKIIMYVKMDIGYVCSLIKCLKVNWNNEIILDIILLL